MKIAAIISEYNPFHNGHLYHVEETKRLGATHIIAIMSGNFVQRGEPAAFGKLARAAMAINNGVDLVIELPLPFAMSTADRFAFGAVGIAEALGCVRLLSFGCESAAPDSLQAAASALLLPETSALTAANLKEGVSYASARQRAVAQAAGPAAAEVLSSPNNTLAVEYLKHLAISGSQISPLAVRRTGAGHDSPAPEDDVASASFIRALALRSGFAAALPFIPKNALAISNKYNFDLNLQNVSSFYDKTLLYKLKAMPLEEIKALPDIGGEGLANRIQNAAHAATRMDEFFALAKTKRYTMARLRRLAFSALLGVDAELCTLPAPYIRVLGIGKNGEEVLKHIAKKCVLPMSHSLSVLSKSGGTAQRFAELEALSTDIYSLHSARPLPSGEDYRLSPVKLIDLT